MTRQLGRWAGDDIGFTIRDSESRQVWKAQSQDENIIKNMLRVIKSPVQKKLSATDSRQDPVKSALTT